LRADCRLEPNALAQIAKQFDDHRECDLVAATVAVETLGNADTSHTRVHSHQKGRGGSELSNLLKRGMLFERHLLADMASDFRLNRPLVAWRRRAAKLAGSFDGALAYAFDADYTLRLLRAGAGLRIVSNPLATIMLSADPSSARYWYQVMCELRTILRRRHVSPRTRFFRLFRHRHRGLEPTVTRSWNPFLVLLALAERPISLIGGHSREVRGTGLSPGSSPAP
jgi:hypothetical protein